MHQHKVLISLIFSVSLVGDTESFGFQTRGELFAPGSPRKFIIPYDSNANARIHSGNGDADLVICYSVIPDNLPFLIDCSSPYVFAFYIGAFFLLFSS